MGGTLQKNIQDILNQVNLMILAIKATGGYKVRKRIQLSDHEIDELCGSSEPTIRLLAVSLVVAEMMLQEPPPLFHPRWDEYQRRRAEVIAGLGKE